MNTQSWMMFAPELGVLATLLLHFFFDLFDTINPKRFIRSLTIGLLFVLGIIFLMPAYSGETIYGMFALNSFAILFKGIFTLATIGVLFMTGEFLEPLGKRANDFCLILVTSLLGSYFLASSNDLITLFITIEWITISLYVLTTFLRNDSYSLEAGTKYLIIGAFSSALFLYGISFVYGAVGSLFFADVKQYVAAGHSAFFIAGIFLILAGIGFKVGMFPFQLWVPDVYEGSPTPVTAFLSVASKTAGFVALLKLFFLALGPQFMNWTVLFFILSLVTLTYGNLAALRQSNIKRLFAYSSLGHVGYLLMGIATAGPSGVEATVYYLIVYACSNLAAFLVIVIANRELGSGEITAYRGLAKKSPFLSGIFFIALLSLAGIPPLGGFFAKFLILNAVITEGYLWPALIGAVNVIIALYYYLSIVKEMYFKQPASKDEIHLSQAARIFLLCLTAGIILAGVVQEPILQLVRYGISALFS